MRKSEHGYAWAAHGHMNTHSKWRIERGVVLWVFLGQLKCIYDRSKIYAVIVSSTSERTVTGMCARTSSRLVSSVHTV